MTNTEHPISDELIWSIRALAQEAEVQFRLYQSYHETADDIVLDFETHLLNEGVEFLVSNQDIKRLDDLISSESGVVGYWNGDAMLYSEFWAQIRTEAKSVLLTRNLPLTAPEPLKITFINIDETPAR